MPQESNIKIDGGSGWGNQLTYPQEATSGIWTNILCFTEKAEDYFFYKMKWEKKVVLFPHLS